MLLTPARFVAPEAQPQRIMMADEAADGSLEQSRGQVSLLRTQYHRLIEVMRLLQPEGEEPVLDRSEGDRTLDRSLLGRSDAFGVIPSALLFGALRAGASRMQFLSQIPIDIINVIQALVLIFVAAPALIRWIYRIRIPAEAESPAGDVQFSSGWGKAET